MPIRTTTPDSASISLTSVPKTRMTTVALKATGLKTGSRYTFWCNGVDMTWACRTPGTRIGSPLITDESGSMTVLFSAEMYPDATLSTTPARTKYHSMLLKDVAGNVRSLSVVTQYLNPKG